MARRIFCCLAFMLGLALQPATAAEIDQCYPDWSMAAPIVRKEGLATIEQVARRAAGRIFGIIVKTELCQSNGGFVYRLVVREPRGRLRALTVDARHPFER
jgi:uncharacterized membrane protein YkoI